MQSNESYLREFHDARPGITARAFARCGSYERLAARVPPGCVLDLACGDGALLRLLGSRAIGVDLSRGELRRAQYANNPVAQARAQALPFRDASFAAVTCHLAFMLFDDIEQVVRELARVLKPGAPLLAVIGGGPTADGHDAYHHFASLVPRTRQLGDPRVHSEAGLRELFADWHDVELERWAFDLGGSFDDVWSMLSSFYQARDFERVRAELRAAFPVDPVPCTIVDYFLRVTR